MNNFITSMKESVISRVSTIKIPPHRAPSNLNFLDAFQENPTIIAEIKLSSPSAGPIYPGALDVPAIANSYLSNGAAALSILTEPLYFNGSIDYIRQVREAYPDAYILQKDFILSTAQIDQGLMYGANAILLIAGFLTPDTLRKLYEYTLSCGLTPLIEIHNLEELEMTLKLNPKLLGINHRNLDTLAIDLDISRTLIQSIPQEVTVIAESGIETKQDLATMIKRGFSGCLIGSHLMQDAYPGRALKQLLGESFEN